MILVIDMGNTNIELGGVSEGGIRFRERMATNIHYEAMEYVVLIKTMLDIHHVSRKEITGCIISSVVPPLTHVIKTAVRKLVKVSPIVVGAGLKTGLNIKIDDPGTMGADLVVGAVAGMAEYGWPLIMVDMGTATTVTALNQQGDYIGGVIIPGVRVSLDSLVSGTSQLPRISLAAPKKVICTNTVDCMKSGIIYGQAAQIDGLIDRFQEELGSEATVIATGGLASVIIPKCHHNIILDPDLMLKGLKIIYDKNAG